MDLILWRHADANPGEDDMSRALTGKGKRQAAQMAKWLEKHLPESTRVLVSPAARTIETAEALGRKYKVIDQLAPGAQAASVLAIADWPASKNPVLIVGHQPTLGQVASLLLFGAEQDVSIRKGAVWWITNRAREPEQQTMLRAAMCTEYL
jgi:phosphohistidine phosphatase